MNSFKKPKSRRRYLPISDGIWIKKLCIDEFTMPGGMQGRWESIHNGNNPTVLMCALTPQRELILINLFRFPVQSFVMELPGGELKKGESRKGGIARELMEETGYKATKISHLCAGFLFDAMSNKKYEIWLAEGCEKIHNRRQLEDVEKYVKLEVILIKIEELKRRISSGEICFDSPISHALIAMDGRGIV